MMMVESVGADKILIQRKHDLVGTPRCGVRERLWIPRSPILSDSAACHPAVVVSAVTSGISAIAVANGISAIAVTSGIPPVFLCAGDSAPYNAL